MYLGCDLSIEEYAKDFEKLGYTHEESIELAKAVMQPITVNMEEIERIADELSRIGCTSFRLTPEECRRLLNEQKTT